MSEASITINSRRSIFDGRQRCHWFMRDGRVVAAVHGFGKGWYTVNGYDPEGRIAKTFSNPRPRQGMALIFFRKAAAMALAQRVAEGRA